MPAVRFVAHGSVWFRTPVDKVQALTLMQAQSSAVRSAYHWKSKLRGVDLTRKVKADYGSYLNHRYILDSITLASQIRSKTVLFGGKQAWRDMVSGALSKEDWQLRRNRQLYSRGDKSNKGNPNLRIVGEELWINDPAARGAWIKAKLFIPSKFRVSLDCYDARLIYEPTQDKFRVVFSWVDDVPLKDHLPGAVGVDCNPDGLGVAEVSSDGNLLKHQYFSSQLIRYARSNQRDYDIHLLAKDVIDTAEATEKPVVIENLKFKQKNAGKKFNRIKNNFPHKKLRQAIKQRASKRGVRVVEVNPAFTSILGALKYKNLYSLNRHTSAALVIGRRGMGFSERQTFSVMPNPKKSGTFNLEGRDVSLVLSGKAWSWLENCFLRPNPPPLTEAEFNPTKEYAHSSSETLDGQSPDRTGHWRKLESSDSNIIGRRKAPSV